MKKNLRSWMAAFVLVAMAWAVAAPALAAPARSSSRAPGVTAAGFLSRLVSELYLEIRTWLGASGLQSATAASGGGMDPNGTSASAPSGSATTTTIFSGGGMDPNG